MWCVPADDDEWETAEVVWAPDEEAPDEAVLGGEEEEVGEEAVEVAIDERAGIDLKRQIRLSMASKYFSFRIDKLEVQEDKEGESAMQAPTAHNLLVKHTFSYPNFDSYASNAKSTSIL